MLRHLLHYGIHFLVPIIIALYFFRNDWRKVALLLLAGILIDLDHLFATPLFDPGRCSIGYHPLHSYLAIMAYALLPLFKPTRILGLALLLHIFADLLDCLLM
ncbi:DUF6122 family protein [Flagellimonas beolgyonensis]|uniref:DUF6122 family protein n=1 Tax=Flagellimonas beolgyonensis TaxID=864064 RepID=UPI000F8F33FF|nr:DUF6122 family protein [Allomuricauda beolgyonensis]